MRTFLRRLAALCLAAVLSSLILSTPASAFGDVWADHWAAPALSSLTSRRILRDSGQNFYPGEPISRQAFLSLVCRAGGLDDRKLQGGANWADPAIAYAACLGWITPEDMAERTAPLSRELAARLLVKAFFPEQLDDGSPGAAKEAAPSDKADGQALPAFSDSGDITPEELPYVKAALRLGLMEGRGNGHFDPQGPLSRAAAAVLLQRALELSEGERTVGASLQVPVLMYHDVSYLGRGFSKTPEIFRRQLEELKDAGFHTVLFSQVLDYVENGTPLPSRPIVITIDDGYASNYTYIYPLLQELDLKAEISVIGDAVQYASWSLRWDQLREMAESGLVGVQCHTMGLHPDGSAQGGRKCALKRPDETWTQYADLLVKDTVKVRDLILQKVGAAPLVYTYPMGKWNAMADALTARLGFPISLTTKNGIAVVRQGDPASLRRMNRIGMDFLNGSVTAVLQKYGYSG